ncbi:O-antigen ligase family protein [Rhodococcus sp. SORGH_AS_0301]|uniref:O-antigen ligase family protein n=1 Tax=Rhodococcus sp. SORGH_AS_0301 TaxID=3041780 RepID=UPI00278A71EE|nr:O-antigen ligase family protein [Rhodococcus sp. SORGH_AS_0301]MDQ1181541.1 hypothetical protein [Rhodococcus sp. SORGH_AS_0301]
MTSRIAGERIDLRGNRLWRLLLAAIVFAVVAAVVTREVYDIDAGTRRTLVVVVTTACAVGAMVLRVQILPSLALVAITLVPPGLFPDELPRSVTPAACVVGVWVVRRIVENGAAALRPWRDPVVLAMYALLVWCLVTTAVSVDLRVSIGWTVGLTVMIAPAVLLDAHDEAALLRTTWSMMAVPLGLYAIAESMFASNVVFGALPGVADPQHWSHYRSVVAFGHPLAAGTFFAVSFVLLLGDAFARTGRRRAVFAVGAAVSFEALLSTVSRGSILAAFLATISMTVAVLLVGGRRAMVRRWRGRPTLTRTRVLTAAAVGVVLAAAAWPTTELVRAVVGRSTSVGASRSNQARREGVDVALDGLTASRGLGVGPGASQRAVDEFNDTGVPIENSYLQLALSIGIPGLVLVTVVLVTAAVIASRRRDWGAAGAVVALAVSIGTYNMIDARPAYHLLIGAVLMIALQSCSGATISSTQSAAELSKGEEVAAKPGPDQTEDRQR